MLRLSYAQVAEFAEAVKALLVTASVYVAWVVN